MFATRNLCSLAKTSPFSLRPFSSVPPRFRVIEKPDPNSPLASFGVYIPLGSRHEPEDYLGVSHFLKHLFFKSTDTRVSIQVCRDLEVLGADFSVTSSRESMFLYASIPKNREHEKYLVRHLVDVIQPREHNDWEPRQLIPTIEMESKAAESDIFTSLSEHLHRVAFRTGLGNSLYAPRYNLEKASLATRGFQKCFNNMIFVHSGASEPAEVDAIANEGPQLPILPLCGSNSHFWSGGEHFITTSSSSTHHLTAYKGVGITDPDFLNAAVLEQILGSVGFQEATSPYMELNVGRTTRLATDFTCIHRMCPINFNYSDAGLFGFYIFSDADTFFAGHTLLLTLALEAPSEDEVGLAKDRLETAHLLQLENKETLLKVTAQDALYNTNLSSSSLQGLESVTPQSVQKFAQRLLSSRPVHVTLGRTPEIPARLFTHRSPKFRE